MSEIERSNKNPTGLRAKSRLAGLAQRIQVSGKQQEEAFSLLLQAVLAFDTTGSMYGYYTRGLEAIRQIVSTVNAASKKASFSYIAYKNHGDEKYFGGERPFAVSPLSIDPEQIYYMMRAVPNGGGGDGLTCLEDVLAHLAGSMNWDSNASKVVTLIGDMPPHGVLDSIGRCPNHFNYKSEVERLRERQVRMYSIYCPRSTGFFGSDRHKQSEEFFRWVAEYTGGMCFSLEDIDSFIAILTGICMKETGQITEFLSSLAHKQLKPAAKAALIALESHNP